MPLCRPTVAQMGTCDGRVRARPPHKQIPSTRYRIDPERMAAGIIHFHWGNTPAGYVVLEVDQ